MRKTGKQSYRIFLPVIIGLVVVGFLFYKEFDPAAFRHVRFTGRSLFWLAMAFACYAVKEFAFIVRLRVLSAGRLTMKQAFRVIILWEFSSAVTPSAIGGAAVAPVFLHREGISIGQSTTIAMLCSIFDELFFVLMFPLLWLLLGTHALFDMPASSWFRDGLLTLAILGFVSKFVWTLLLCYGVFVNSRGLSVLIYRLSHLPFVCRWKRKAAQVASDISKTSKDIQSKDFHFWWKSYLTTLLSWTSRYLVVNCLFLAFFPVEEHFLLFARQVTMFLSMLYSPTPGGSGIAEVIFNEYLSSFIPFAGLSVVLALLWRLITYYSELVLGIMLLPKWLGRKKSV